METGVKAQSEKQQIFPLSNAVHTLCCRTNSQDTHISYMLLSSHIWFQLQSQCNNNTYSI